MNGILERFAAEREYGQIEKNWQNARALPKRLPVMITGLCEGAEEAFLATFVSRNRHVPALILVPDEKTARRVITALSHYDVTALFYPVRDPVYYNIISSHDAEYERLYALSELKGGHCPILVSTPDAVLQETVPASLLTQGTLELSVGGTADMRELAEKLVAFGYTPTDLVDGKGKFSIRGGIADIFSPQGDAPIRMELFGDEIDQIGFFDILTQRKTENIQSYNIIPAREILPSEQARSAILAEVEGLIKKAKSAEVRTSLSHERDMIVSGMELPFAEKYMTCVYPEPASLLDYFPEDGAVFLLDSAGMTERLKGALRMREETVRDLITDGLASGRSFRMTDGENDLFRFAEKTGAMVINPFLTQYPGRLSELYTYKTRTTAVKDASAELLADELQGYLRSRYEIVIAAGSETEASATEELLRDRDIRCQTVTDPAKIQPVPGYPTVTVFGGTGFELMTDHFLLLSLGGEQAGPIRTRARRGSKNKKTSQEKILSYADLTVGDYVVLETHGIGKYMGLETIRDYQGVCHDHIKIQYAGADVLYVRCEQIETVSKYIGAGADDDSLKLSKLGGMEWTHAKARVKGEVKEMAKELIALYAERLRRPGYAFPQDDAMQRDFETSFDYEETEGQLAAAEEIKRDMERPVPMDRLLCGDVGFGKTEVALRAAFKAVVAGKQVAILVPTTILAMQHYQTICSRMRDFPVKAALLSRFRTAGEQEATVRALRRGEVDIIVGTHRLLSADIQFHDLGLVIIDEEQRFGVAHKEKLKQMAKNVDVLTLTATPIPRTLNMAMNTIRDMSVLDEAPGDRVPVQTYVLEYDDVLIHEAIRRELHRGGQVFYLYNRVETITSAAAKLGKAFPDARIEIAHGQMEKEELADIWQSLVAGEIDILVCTTIIETGVDVPNANTLIIENADTMGLAQLHQIRGRVGRSARRAYAYFTYRQGKALSEISAKRLAAIRDYTEFGSGFKIALRDLEIRGAGDVLGARQHGHMQSVGYDMYLKILNEAVLEEKGEIQPKKMECTISVGRDSYIPESYIASPSQRIDMYKKIAAIETEEDLDDIADELLDRYGDMPTAVETLLCASLARSQGGQCGFTQIDRRENAVLIYPAKLDFAVWSQMAAAFPARIVITPSDRSYVTCKCKRGEPVFEWIRELLKKYLQLKSEKE
ncbi:MAG: transcription-repair coupling factor [Ruminococcus sp.]|nr:transcription-repair coupling factor [Candidatus Apopatosoma intestinale]